MSDARDYFHTPDADPVVEVTDPFASAPGAQTSPTSGHVAELTADLQRVSAEYANYRRRVERDRQANADSAVAKALLTLLPVLDDIERADQHDELTGGFRVVAERLHQELNLLGLIRFGRAGDVFDPRVHDAVSRVGAADVTEPVCLEVLAPGYTYKGGLVRAAHVAVAVPAPEPAGDSPDEAPEGAQET